MPTKLVDSTAQAASLFATGRAMKAGVVSAEVLALTDAILMSILTFKLKVIAAALLTAGVVAAVGLALLHRATADGLRPVAKSEAAPRGREVPIVRKLEHGEQVLGVAFSPDGKVLAAGGRSGALLRGFGAKIGVLRLHDSRTGELLRSITGLDDIWALAFSPDGKALAAATNTDGLVTLFDTANWAVTRSIPIGRPTSLAFSRDGRTLAVGSMIADSAGMVTLLDLAGKAQPRRLAPQPESVLSVALSSDGQHLATGGYDKTARVYDVATGTPVRTRTTPSWANAVAFSPDGTILAIGSSPDAFLWNWGVGRRPGTKIVCSAPVHPSAANGSRGPGLMVGGPWDWSWSISERTAETAAAEGRTSRVVSTV